MGSNKKVDREPRRPPRPAAPDGAVDAQRSSRDERPFYREQLDEAQSKNGIDSEGDGKDTETSGKPDQPAATGKGSRSSVRKKGLNAT